MTAALDQALAWQQHSLQLVSRTFALTIPQLPESLRVAVGNGYLLCRIADTIEDDPTMPWEEKAHWQQVFLQVVEGHEDPAVFAGGFGAQLSADMPAAEHDLVRHTADVVQITHSFSASQQAALARCVRIMGAGMAEFQQHASLKGLVDMPAMDHYCYVVAGVVGEMLTSLFVEYEPRLRAQETEMQGLAVSFGQGLQMTNILKDIWDDWARGVSWMPSSVFAQYGCDIAAVQPGSHDPGFQAALQNLLDIAAEHLENALQYTLMIPADQTGMRDFCLWALAMAVLTLRRIAENPAFASGAEVKISRNSVQWVVMLSKLMHRSDGLLLASFRAGIKPLRKTARVATA
ncbi:MULTISPECIES: phytoene/squalene synthase family protein [Acidithiobacillus]|uniref:Phytoene synthase n=1 Tax=Acidithiobacillus thiooxidans ATCC 19377 TaxID=637390 RepID=A0A5P9XPL6_ACITH|nr:MULTISPECIES: phytoene/squalene synthase family protein [Acidithiobacillus]MBU2743234.1 phytoene/squalene synthase family protein [Acidithiobacillus albertensis]QFX95313.1 phytoene synthase [Acidithiobacillus thiooxidans ATCC 19377]